MWQKIAQVHRYSGYTGNIRNRVFEWSDKGVVGWKGVTKAHFSTRNISTRTYCVYHNKHRFYLNSWILLAPSACFTVASVELRSTYAYAALTQKGKNVLRKFNWVSERTAKLYLFKEPSQALNFFLVKSNPEKYEINSEITAFS